MPIKKLSLSIDALQVESFETTKLADRSGTVDGHSPGFGTYYGPTCETTCYLVRCDCTYGEGTCDLSCGGEPGCDYTASPEACPSEPGYPGCN